MKEVSALLILGEGGTLLKQLEAWLTPYGWICAQSDAPTLSAEIIVITADKSLGIRDNFVRIIRASDDALGSTPILFAADNAEPLPPGMSAILPTPLDRGITLATIADWSGPLADHAFRDMSNPRYRLLRMAGATKTDDLMRRFAAQLEDGIRSLDVPAFHASLAHQIAGAAGMFGFAELSETWRAINANDSFDRAEAIAQTRAVMVEIRRRLR